MFSAKSSAGNPRKYLVESLIMEAARGGCILDRDPEEEEDDWRRSGGGGGGSGGSRPATAAAAAAYLDSLLR